MNMLSINEAAKRLNLTRQYVWALASTGRIEAEVFSNGNRQFYRIPEIAIQKLMEARANG